MNISGKTRIFKNDKGYYNTSISNKKQDGTYENMYITVQLPKNTELENRTEIEITKGFLTFYKNQNGLAIPKIVIQEFEQEGNTNNTTNEFIGNNGDLPF